MVWRGACQVGPSLYSAPFRLVGQSLWLRATPTTVQLFHNRQLVATHRRPEWKHRDGPSEPPAYCGQIQHRSASCTWPRPASPSPRRSGATPTCSRRDGDTDAGRVRCRDAISTAGQAPDQANRTRPDGAENVRRLKTKPTASATDAASQGELDRAKRKRHGLSIGASGSSIRQPHEKPQSALSPHFPAIEIAVFQQSTLKSQLLFVLIQLLLLS